ncbi:MAG: ribbon-helix-helix protein, CopG family [Rubrobacter sp.]|nr:ribbon-helix-helix protein, CopG family [Rubrobacter sp.]
MVQLNDRLLDLLDRHAARRGISRSALIRMALEDFLRSDQEALVGDQIVEGYRRIPPASPEEWGGLEQLTDNAAVDVLHRLDAEEIAAGHEQW